MKMINASKKLAVRAGQADGKLYRMMIENDPAAKRVMVEPGLAVYLMGDGSTIEVYGAGACYPDYLFAYGNTVVSYKVDNLEKAVRALSENGAVLQGDIEHVCTYYSYCHMLTAEQTIIGLFEQD